MKNAATISQRHQCQCEINHVRDFQPLTSEEDYEKYMAKEVNLGGGERKTIKDTLVDGMEHDFPHWRTQQYSVPSADDAATHETAYIVPGVTGDELYNNFL